MIGRGGEEGCWVGRGEEGGREGGRGNNGGLDLHGKAIEDEEM